MTAAVLWGLGGVLAALTVSEGLLRLRAARSAVRFWRLCLLGTLIRAAVVLIWIAGGLASKAVAPAPFVLTLLGGYLAVQVVEGLRYRRFIATR